MQDCILGKFVHSATKKTGYTKEYIIDVLEGNLDVDPKFAKTLCPMMGIKPDLILRMQNEFNDKKKASKKR